MTYLNNNDRTTTSVITRICNYFQNKRELKNDKHLQENDCWKIASSNICKKCNNLLRPIKGKNDLMFPPGSLQCRSCGRINIPR